MSDQDPITRLNAALSGRYRIERELGAGGMATVYLAHDLKHDRQVAIKVLHEDLAFALGAERFLAEIRTTARLQHPHILPLLDSGSTAPAGESGGLLYYVMQYVAGESLRDRLKRENQLLIEDALLITREVADALGHAHGQGIIHRDIKPENILLQGGHALVADFGIALAVQSAGGARLTQTGLSLGTPQYMSPEQAMGERTVDARSDVYALGAVLYEMLTGEPPFTGSTVAVVVAKVLALEPVSPTSMRRSVPEHVEVAVLKALAKLPADRWGSVAEFVAGLQGGHDAPRARKSTAWRGVGARRGLLVGSLVAGIAAVSIMQWNGRSDTEASAPSVALTISLPDSMQLVLDGVARSVDLTPDGRIVVFVARTESSSRAYWRSLDDFTLHAIAGSEGAVGLLVAPDGGSIAAFFGEVGRGHRIRRLALDGSSALDLAENVNVDASWESLERVLTTGRDGVEIQIVSTTGNGTSEVSVTEGVAALAPNELPGGEWALAHLYTFHPEGDFTAIGAVSLDSGEARVLTRAGLMVPDSARVEDLMLGLSPRYVRPGFISYTRLDGAIMLARFDAQGMRVLGEARPVLTGVQVEPYYANAQYAVADNGTVAYAEGSVGTMGRFVWVGEAGTLDPLPIPAGIYGSFKLSRDGRRLISAVRPAGGPQQLWTFDLTGGSSEQRVPDVAPRFESGWFPDGESFLYESATGWLYRRSVRDMEVIDSVKTDGFGVVYDIAPDGQTVARVRFRRGEAGIVFMSWPSGEEVVVDSDPTAAFGSFSPDGRWFAYGRADRSQFDFAIYITSVVEPRRVQRVRAGFTPVWSRDSNTIYFGEVWRVLAVTREGDTFGEPRVVYNGRFLVGGQVIQVGPDGRLLIVVPEAQRPVREIRVVTNWLERATSQLPQ